MWLFLVPRPEGLCNIMVLNNYNANSQLLKSVLIERRLIILKKINCFPIDVDLELESVDVIDESRLLDSNNQIRSRSTSISTLSIAPYPIEDEKAISFLGALKIPVTSLLIFDQFIVFYDQTFSY